MKLSQQLLRWYDKHRRELPWRRPMNGDSLPDPYHVLVSETMLQQTQVATVVPYFERFLAAFPTLNDLAAADEQDVLRLWQGLGYYARARHLLSAARAVVAQHGGVLPAEPAALMTLPGIGRYTAGAIASIAYDRLAPIVDGNVARVLCRLDAVTDPPTDPRTREHLWRRAAQLLPRRRAGDFNSALMELGATICTPRAPECARCPVQEHCQAHAAGVAHQIPAPKPRPHQLRERRWTFCIHHRGRWLIEQRPPTGRWAGMWQFITFETPESEISAAELLRQRLGPAVSTPKPLANVRHTLTHRRYEFAVFHCRAVRSVRQLSANRKWVRLADLPAYPLPTPHTRIAALLPPA